MKIKRVFQKVKNLYHLSKAVSANVFFGFPSRRIKIIGVTGTNGKTTTVEMIGRVLDGLGKKVAVYSTIKFRIGQNEEINKTKFTTQSSWNLQKFIKKVVAEKCDYLVLETSSHALDQNRVWGVDYDIAVITNITREHLDYHFDMEDYCKTKLKLFKRVASFLKRGKGLNFVNCDMENFERFVLPGVKNFLYGINYKQKTYKKNLVWKAKKIKLTEKGSEFEVDGFDFELQLPGKFNIENALAAICVGVSQGVPVNILRKKLKEIDYIPGRMESVKNKKGVNIIIDYALTPDSMEKVGKIFKKKNNPKSKLIWVFGSCGNRDRGKRPIMGRIVAKYADQIITTNEDPYGENPIQIIEEIEAGIKDKTKLIRIVSRRKALEKALDIAKRGDTVLVTGKGAEENMQIGNKKIDWNDRRVIEKILEN